MKIFRSDAGSATQLGSQAVPISGNTWYTYKVTYCLNTIKFFLNGVQQVSARDSTYKNGAVLRLWVSNTQGEFARLFVRNFVDPEPSHGDWGNEEEPASNYWPTGGGGRSYSMES
jgi:hypothetical protein